MSQFFRIPLIAIIAIAFASCLSSCGHMQTPFGARTTLGTDTTGYVAAKGNVNINPETGSISANELLIVGSELQGDTFRHTGDSIVKGIGYYILGGVAKAGIGAYKSVTNVKSMEGTKQVVSNNGVKTVGLQEATKQQAISAQAATEQAAIAAGQ